MPRKLCELHSVRRAEPKGEATPTIRQWLIARGTTWAEMRRYSRRLAKQRMANAALAATAAMVSK
jgi:hypothetical protein